MSDPDDIPQNYPGIETLAKGPRINAVSLYGELCLLIIIHHWLL